MTGSNLGCGRSLFVIPLTRPQTLDWTGIWRTCDLTSKYERGDKDLCHFLCHCLGGCEEIQIMKRPRKGEQRSWSLCDIAIAAGTKPNIICFLVILPEYLSTGFQTDKMTHTETHTHTHANY